MKYEFHAQYPFALQDGTIQAFAVDWLAGKTDRLPPTWREIAVIQDPMQQIMLLSQAIVTEYKDQARVGTRREEGGYLFWLRHQAPGFLQRQREAMQAVGLAQRLPPDLTIFPTGSWALQFTFTLRTPYLSRDDVDFYILDNPVKKEHVFKVPYVAPSQWKGALRSAMMRELVFALQEGRVDEARFVADRLRLYRLFGNEKDGTAEFLDRAWALHRAGPCPETDDAEQRNAWEQRFQAARKAVSEEFEQLVRDRRYRVGDVEGFQGRLHFYPTYFDRLDLEVINPHPRDTGAGKQPIYFESVPADTKGCFTLLYVPFDRIGEDEAATRKQVAEDLPLVAQGLQAMFTLYGFGAKTSSGFGLAEDRVSDGRIQTNVLEEVQQAPRPQEPAMPDALRTFLEAFPGEDFGLKPNEWRKRRGATTSQRKQYMEARAAHTEYEQARQEYEANLAEWEAQAAEPARSFIGEGFNSFRQLAEDAVEKVAARLTTGGAQ